MLYVARLVTVADRRAEELVGRGNVLEVLQKLDSFKQADSQAGGAKGMDKIWKPRELK